MLLPLPAKVAWPCCPIDGGPLRPNEDLDLVCMNCGRVLYRQPVTAGAEPWTKRARGE